MGQARHVQRERIWGRRAWGDENNQAPSSREYPRADRGCAGAHRAVMPWDGRKPMKAGIQAFSDNRQTWMVVLSLWVAMVAVPSASKWKKGCCEPGSLAV